MKYPPIAREKQLPLLTLFISYRVIYSYGKFLRDHRQELGCLRKEHRGLYGGTPSCWSGEDISDIFLAPASIGPSRSRYLIGHIPIVLGEWKKFPVSRALLGPVHS